MQEQMLTCDASCMTKIAVRCSTIKEMVYHVDTKVEYLTSQTFPCSTVINQLMCV